ncbi:lichenan operon transcriptional antiterminator [Amphibacillus marinus]|uniref:Lichenan operon transcriptional antiterminator n=1 Tax=Amphibacillus marinus TaxID=872970 RepID=A0A1H8TAM0_9BACI|nr:BglG family transcription antiterminator [Amphibacillus marinus]SEO87543.1 lichenan operon transcriptional antiterminator [Amphibacillus marinus]
MKLLTKREVEILHLLRNSKDLQTGKSLALLLGVTTRTIRNDVKRLNITISKYDAEIVSYRGKGYELEIREGDAFQQLYSSHVALIQDRKAITETQSENELENQIIKKILMNCLTDTSIYQEELAEELFISLSALKSYLASVREKIATYGLVLATDRLHGIKVTGNEDKIRFCISQYLFNHQSIGVYNDIFPDNEIKRIKDLTLHVLLSNQLQLTDVALENLIIHIEITIRRYLNNRLSDYHVHVTEQLKSTKEYKVASELIEQIKEVLKINIESEIFYLTQHLLASGRLYMKDINREEYSKMVSLLNKVFWEISEKTSIDLSDDQKLIDGLIVHLSVALKRIEYQMNIRNEVLSSIKNNYPLAFQLAAIASNKISELTKLNINVNEIGFIAIHFGVALEKKGLNQQELKKIIIVCGSGLATASLIRERLLNSYGAQVSVVETIRFTEFQKELIDKVDMIVTTVPIPIESNKIFTISPVLSSEDLKTLKRKLLAGNHMPDVANFYSIFKQDLFVKDVQLSSKDDVLHYVTNLMAAKGYIDAYTKQSIYDRETMASTELSNLLAIPHPLDNSMTEPSIAVCVLAKPITWDREKVQVVVVLSVPKHQQKTWETLFRQLYLFLIEEFGITKLISTYSYNDFIKNLSKYKEKNL